ncbi:PREDICTED: F-box/kelch-repeat protein At3g18720-like [Camelina sativa]|uniref:F-box/kelch-repeat protein At3g18720-like n=1 Tax=Camelina sativa TaxID=90675 RepID=A0ABM1RSK1_CAMSA|nr:PREDICTED: F-box/kelch-repeat protein At3g18720-like [Camelina sativa]
MRPRRRTYTAATSPSLVTVKPIVEAVSVPVSDSKRRIRKLQSCTAKKAKDGSKKKNKCDIGGLWGNLIPLDILRKILSGLGLKANIQASAVCKAWCEAAVSVRKFQILPPPLLFNSRYSMHSKGDAIPYPLRFPTCKLQFPGTLHCSHNPAFSKDCWVLSTQDLTPLLRNPFTRETFYLPCTRSFRWLAFSAAPTSASCMVISYTQINATVVVDTWRPGETVWITYSFENQLPFRIWGKCVFSNGMFYCLSTCGYLGVFHPSKEATWNVLPLKKPCPAFDYLDNFNPVFMTEHEGDIFVIYTHYDNSNPSVFKLNSKRKEWQEKRDLGGLTIFTSLPASFVRAGLSTVHRNKIYSSCIDEFEQYGMYYSLGDLISSDPPPTHRASYHHLWVEPPPNNNFYL